MFRLAVSSLSAIAGSFCAVRASMVGSRGEAAANPSGRPIVLLRRALALVRISLLGVRGVLRAIRCARPAFRGVVVGFRRWMLAIRQRRARLRT